MPISYVERDKLMQDPEIRKRVQHAFWDVCVDVLLNSKSTAEEKASARTNLRGVLENDEMQVLLLRAISASGKNSSDAELKAVAAAVFPDLV